MQQNNIKKKNQIREQKKERKNLKMPNMIPGMKVPKAFALNVRTLLDGSFLTKEKFIRQAPFFAYVLVLAVLYIAINFFADKTLLTIEKTKDEIKELRFEFITVSSELIQFTQASNVARILKDDGLKRPMTPPEKIFIPVKNKKEQ